MKNKLLIFAILFSGLLHAEEKAWVKQDYEVDWKYKAGEYLIYDCERMHYVCVDKEGDANCREERNFSQEKKLPHYPCAPLKKFKDKRECVQENYKIVDIGANKRFCFPQ